MADNINTTLEDLLAAIREFTEKSGQCCETKGSVVEDPPSDGEVIVGPDEQFPDTEEYFDAKCNTANAIYDTVLGVIDWLDANNVDLISGFFGAITSGLAVAFLLSGPVGWALVAVGGSVATTAWFLVRYALDFTDVSTALGQVHSECVLALYNAANTTEAKANFLTEVDGATQPITSVERQLLGFLLNYNLLNQLFGPREDVASYQSPSPISCPSSWSHVFDFTISAQGWTNDATHSRPFGTYSAGVGWVSVWGSVSGGFDERLYLERTGASGEVIQSVTVEYEFVGVCGPGRQVGIKVWNGAVVQRTDAKTPTCGLFTHEGVFSDVGTIITTSAVGDASSDGALEITITSITVTGSGSDPF